MLTKVLQPAAVEAGLGRVTWHQFRHIHSSLLNDLNVPAKIAQEQLGHASITTTLGIYTHRCRASHRDGGRSGRGAIVRAIALECSRIRRTSSKAAAPASDSVN